jgi:hypothetical protein
MNIARVPLAQVLKGRDGREYEISGHAADIAQRLREIDPSLDVHVNEAGYFVITQLVDAGGKATSVETDTTTRKLAGRVPWGEWDERIVKEFQERAWYIRHGISRADVLEASDARRHADAEYQLEQEVKERAYPLYRTFQRIQLGSNPRAFIAKGLA